MTLAAYEEIIELGTGARGRVVLARERSSGVPATIRYLAARPGEVRREAALLSRIDDPRLARVLGVQDSPDGPALLLAPVEGVDLRRLLAGYRVLAPEAALRVLKDSLLGLAAAHRAGVLHRDYRPASVVVQPDGTCRLVDLGVVRPGGPDGSLPDYPAPERRSGGPASPAADVYAATSVFAECLTGDGGDRPLPEGLLPLVRRGTAADPRERPSDALEFAAELEEAAVAAYGPDWELLGAVALAGAVAGIPPAFTLAQVARPPAPVPAEPEPGAPAPGAGGRRLLSQVGGVKTIAAVLVGVVVGLAAAVAGTRAFLAEDARPAASSARPRVKIAKLDRTFADLPLEVRGAQYPQVEGMADAALQKRVNAVLRKPVDDLVALQREATAAAQEYVTDRSECSGPDLVDTKVRLGLQGPRYLSAIYGWTGTTCGSDGTRPRRTVTVDLTTGEVLRLSDVLRPDRLTGEHLGALTGLLTCRDVPGRGPCPDKLDPFALKTMEDSGWEGLSVFLEKDAFTLVYSVEGSSENEGDYTGPYDEVSGYLSPGFLKTLERA